MRKVIEVTIDEEGRDKGKVYRITEASAIRADKWGMRVMTLLQLPEDIVKMGLVGILVGGVHRLRGIAWEDLEPLMDEMMTCVVYVPTPSVPTVTQALTFDDAVEEWATMGRLRYEVMKLHLGFSPPAAP